MTTRSINLHYITLHYVHMRQMHVMHKMQPIVTIVTITCYVHMRGVCPSVSRLNSATLCKNS